MKLTDFKALTFDCYGTLIDWESGMVAGLKPLTDKVSRHLNRDEILEAHAFHESTQQRWTPAYRYADLLPIVYKRLAEEWGVTVTPEECAAYGQSVKDWTRCNSWSTAASSALSPRRFARCTNPPSP